MGQRGPPTDAADHLTPSDDTEILRPRRRGAIRGRTLLAVVAVMLATTGVVAGVLATSPSSVRPFEGLEKTGTLSPTSPANFVAGPLSANDGPYLTDRSGRVVMLHGVNVVYKHAPFLAYPDPGHPWNFTRSDASEIAKLGFNVVRLGMTWQGLEPGRGGPNSPAVCSPGPPRDPHEFNARVADAYMAKLAQTVNLLGRYHVYTLLDMHQDVYSEAFAGEGAPPWAVCTNGLRPDTLPGRWSNTYSSASLITAEQHFWSNNVVGDLQGEYLKVWQAVARYFHGNPWVVGYDPINEPFTFHMTTGDPQVATQLDCFYTGTAQRGRNHPYGSLISCPRSDPRQGLISTIQSVDRSHLIFYEPDIFGHKHQHNTVGPLDYPNLVYNFHSYCGYRSPVTGDPTNVEKCAGQEMGTIQRRSDQRADNFTVDQPGGPGWFLSEFGATDNPDLIARTTAAADQYQLGWAYWSWKYFKDPTGSADEALVKPSGRLSPIARALAEVYPQAIAGVPRSFSFNPFSRTFGLTYLPRHRIKSPTVIQVPVALQYRHGYCASIIGGRTISRRDAAHLVITNAPKARKVSVTVSPGRCD